MDYFSAVLSKATPTHYTLNPKAFFALILKQQKWFFWSSVWR